MKQVVASEREKNEHFVKNREFQLLEQIEQLQLRSEKAESVVV